MASPYARFLAGEALPIPGREAQMVRNNAGGYGFKLSPWERLNRFLVLGSEGGTYYVGERTLTEQNAQGAIACIKENGPRVVELARRVNVENLAPKTDQQLFVLALCMRHGDQATKNAVTVAAPSVLRTGTHLLHFADMLNGLGGWNRSKRRIITRWLTNNSADFVAFQALKYQSRDGWSMKDVLRVSHPKAPYAPHAAVYDWICGREGRRKDWPDTLEEYAIMRSSLEEMKVEAVLSGIDAGLPREALPTEYLRDLRVSRALLPTMGIHALLRNLGALTESEVLADVEHSLMVADRVRNRGAMQRARVHPFAILLAALVYGQGHGFRSSKTWSPVRQVLEALDDAYETAFEWNTPTKRRLLVGIDISGSMSMECQGTPIPAHLAAAAMALTIARAEPFSTVVQHDTEVRQVVPITRRSKVSGLSGAHGGGTDLSAPIRWAYDNGEFDAIVILTDNESWAANIHWATVLAEYRRKVPNCKLIVAAMAANHASIVDPDDPLQLGCAGLDANLPSIINNFLIDALS